jgi:microcompartment protein CcmK/EutM
MDSVGAGLGEVVFYVAGSSSRMTATTEGKPSDATIISIVDSIDINGKYVYRKEKK